MIEMESNRSMTSITEYRMLEVIQEEKSGEKIRNESARTKITIHHFGLSLVSFSDSTFVAELWRWIIVIPRCVNENETSSFIRPFIMCISIYYYYFCHKLYADDDPQIEPDKQTRIQSRNRSWSGGRSVSLSPTTPTSYIVVLFLVSFALSQLCFCHTRGHPQ